MEKRILQYAGIDDDIVNTLTRPVKKPIVPPIMTGHNQAHPGEHQADSMAHVHHNQSFSQTTQNPSQSS